MSDREAPWSERDRDVAVAVHHLGRVNPFVAERRDWERRALGDRFVAGPALWGLDEDAAEPNLDAVAEVAEQVGERMRDGLERAPAWRPTAEDRELYGGVVFMVLYNRHSATITVDAEGLATSSAYPAYVEDFRRLFRPLGPPDREVDTPAHLFACFWQIRRAYEVILSTIVGGSLPTARLRAAVWQSVFSFDAGRYRRYLFRAMPDIPTLITGPTGTGKELVARAIALSGYAPFDEGRRRFAHPPTVLPLNLQAMPASLVESELFGHRKGAFTGAVADRDGWLAVCPRGGAVFLDEIGELDPMLQVKLLRVLEDRAFSPVGDTRSVRFAGKIVAATHRDLPAQIDAGVFRADLYYRLCGDRIAVPSLQERIHDDPRELGRVLRALIARWVAPTQVDGVVDEVEREIVAARGRDWRWPGNVRELAQCARNVLVQGTCGPPERIGEPSAARADAGLDALADAGVSLADVQARYVRTVFARHGSYKAAAQALGVDWRTVKAHVDADGGTGDDEDGGDGVRKRRPRTG